MELLTTASREKTVHEGATNKRMMALFVHSCNIRGRFAITPKAYDDVIIASNAVFRVIADLAMTTRSMETASVAKCAPSQ
jgi:hypothetical protein